MRVVNGWQKQLWDRFVSYWKNWFGRHWKGLLGWRESLFLSEESFHLILAIGVGIIGGVANLGFYLVYQFLVNLAVHQPGDLADIAEDLAPWQRFLVPTLGGIIAGLILCAGVRLFGREGSGNLLEAVAAGNGRLPLRTGLFKNGIFFGQCQHWSIHREGRFNCSSGSHTGFKMGAVAALAALPA